METFLIVLFLFLIVQRLGELVLAQSNRKWMLNKGAIETGEGHYFLFILLHALFFIGIWVEFIFTTYQWSSTFFIIFPAFVLLQIFRVWCILSLGRRWNTRILVLPGEKPIQKGLYRYFRHPNYIIVFLELMIIPLLFQAYISAFVFPLLHLLVLTVRVPAEERALNERV